MQRPSHSSQTVLAGTSLSAIADLAGIARTTLYEYFDSKDELLIAIVEERVPPTLQALVDDIPATDPLERLEEIFRRCHRLAADFLDITLVFFRVGRELPPDSRDRLWESLSPITKELFRICRNGVESGRFAAGNPYHLGRAVADLLVGGIDQLTQNEDVVYGLELVLEARIRFLRAGLLGLSE